MSHTTDESAEIEALRKRIAELEQSEAALRASETLYRAAVAVLDTGIIIHLANYRIVACNVNAEQILGIPANQLIGRTPDDTNWQALDEDGAALSSEHFPSVRTLRDGKPLTN